MNPFQINEEEELNSMTFPPENVQTSLLDQLQASRGFTQEKETGLRDDISKAAPGAAASFLASFGAGLAGNSQAGAMQALNRNQDSAKARLDEYLASKRNVLTEANQEKQLQKISRDEISQTEEDDPNSKASESARQAAAKALNVPVERFAGISARKLQDTSPVFAKTIESERNRRQQLELQDKKDVTAVDIQNKKDVATSENKSVKPTIGQDGVDRAFAKEYNDWSSGGQSLAKNELNKLQGLADRLKSGEVTTGGLTGIFPDRMTSNAVLSARADVTSTVMKSLRALLGAAFTEKEGERVIKATWNEADSTKNNIERIERLMSDLDGQAIAKDKKAKFYEENGTIQGFKIGGSPTQKSIPNSQDQRIVESPSFPQTLRNELGEEATVESAEELEEAMLEGFS